MKKGIKILICLLVIVALACGGVYVYSKINADINGTEKGESKEYTLIINADDFQYEVAKDLMNNGIVLDDSLGLIGWINITLILLILTVNIILIQK